MSDIRTPKLDGIPKTDMKELREGLEEDSVYLVEAATTENNVVHKAVLFMGFKSGSYCMVYNNTYDHAVDMSGLYYIKVIEKLTSMK